MINTQGHLTIARPGPLSTLQDAGRFGVRHLGVSQGGPADLYAWAWANWLVGNQWGSSALEITLGGLSLTTNHPCTLALAGAPMQAHINGQPQENWQSFTLYPKQQLTLAMAKQGLRSYLAIAGGFCAPTILGSTACVVRDGLGGHQGDGRPLAAADELAFIIDSQRISNRQLSLEQLPDYQSVLSLPVILGAQSRHFDNESLLALFEKPWQVDPRSDRMGIRLQGSLLHCKKASPISEGIPLGSIQVPPDGQPIVLLNDRQTIGGYPRLGTLPPLACAQLAQCRPGQTVRFVATTSVAAMQGYRAFREQLNHA